MLLNRTPRYCAPFFMGGGARCSSLFEHAPDHQLPNMFADGVGL